MKNQIHKILSAFMLALYLMSASGTALAAHWHHGGGGWRGGVYIGVGPGYYPGYYNSYPSYGYGPYYHCGWVRGHWDGPYWVPAHRACWYN